MRETHSMAVEFVQHGRDATCDILPEIPRISRDQVQHLQLCNKSSVKQYHFKGNKKPVPPKITLQCGLSYDLLCRSGNSLQAALEKDISWLVSLLQNSDEDDPPPEWAGAMVQSCRMEGMPDGPASQSIFGPLIDMPPSHPDTVLTTLMFIEKSLKNRKFIHLCADMQLYKVILQIKWSDPCQWKNLVVRPGGMHTLMSFIGCIGTLMNGSGLEDILEVAFRGLEAC
ncbi:uncharacterized protein [Macrobrachium rosenbergii]|uniref:uncharacterized protein n=1 Tax=Macrobrachium rosenbergii TaxID=79674 RepID=UPI0034D66641